MKRVLFALNITVVEVSFKMMRIENSQGNEIVSLEDWAKLYDTPRQKHQWKEHRSAYSVADFLINRNGSTRLQSRISSVLSQPIELERAIPEYELRFDEYGRGRIHDLGIFGSSGVDQSVFVGVEAKVDEQFGLSVHDVYLGAKAKQIVGESTKAPERIENLLSLHFSEPHISMFDVRYQLLYATAGTLAANADISVLYVIVFKTPLYNESIGAENYRDYIHFMNMIGGKSIKVVDKGTVAHEVELGGRRLVTIYEYFELLS